MPWRHGAPSCCAQHAQQAFRSNLPIPRPETQSCWHLEPWKSQKSQAGLLRRARAEARKLPGATSWIGIACCSWTCCNRQRRKARQPQPGEFLQTRKEAHRLRAGLRRWQVLVGVHSRAGLQRVQRLVLLAVAQHNALIFRPGSALLAQPLCTWGMAVSGWESKWLGGGKASGWAAC